MVKTVLMCRPTYFEVAYEINAWMHVDNPVDVTLAKTQWQKLYDTYEKLGYEIQLIEPASGLPDMVFTANGGLFIEGKAMLPKFKHPERQPETAQFEAWFRANGAKEICMPKNDFEGEGDCLYNGYAIFAGHGFRSSPKAADELAEFFNKPVVSLRLVDPKFYHLDTAMCPIDSDTVMYYPAAFDAESRQKLVQHFPKQIEASPSDSAAFGLNAVSDGGSIVMSAAAEGLIRRLKSEGYNPIGIDVSEFRKSGGGVKCCTLELHHG
ncbi:MAG TPA: arginine deiminase family protein [Candidatus Dormibacteraeota bacterium]|nr:arginine deiminase family protein [Candidatus Dormibacteraeota bacterium]